MANRQFPRVILSNLRSGYAINVPAEWQDPNSYWWRDQGLADEIISQRLAEGVVLHDAIWARTTDNPEPSPVDDNYSFDEATQRYQRTDIRV